MQKIVDKERLEDYLKTLRVEKFTGKVTINFFKGGVTNISEEKSIKVN